MRANYFHYAVERKAVTFILKEGEAQDYYVTQLARCVHGPGQVPVR